METEIETAEEKAFFESGGEAAPEPEKPEQEQAAAEPEKAEEPAAPEPEKQEAAPEAEKGQVPYSALHEERMLRKEANEKLTEVQDQVSQLQGLREELTAFRDEKKAEQDQTSYDDDPIGHLREQQEQMQSDLRERDQQTETQQAQIQEVQQLQNTINAQVNEFVKDNADYQDALTYVTERRTNDLLALGIIDPVQQQQILNTEAWNIAQTALQNNKNPADVVYTMAKSWGYKQAAGQAEKTDLDKQVETIQKGQQESQTLSDAGGTPDSADISLSDIESMSDNDFDKLWDKMENGG